MWVESSGNGISGTFQTIFRTKIGTKIGTGSEDGLQHVGERSAGYLKLMLRHAVLFHAILQLLGIAGIRADKSDQLGKLLARESLGQQTILLHQSLHNIP